MNTCTTFTTYTNTCTTTQEIVYLNHVYQYLYHISVTCILVPFLPLVPILVPLLVLVYLYHLYNFTITCTITQVAQKPSYRPQGQDTSGEEAEKKPAYILPQADRLPKKTEADRLPKKTKADRLPKKAFPPRLRVPSSNSRTPRSAPEPLIPSLRVPRFALNSPRPRPRPRPRPTPRPRPQPCKKVPVREPVQTCKNVPR